MELPQEFRAANFELDFLSASSAQAKEYGLADSCGALIYRAGANPKFIGGSIVTSDALFQRITAMVEGSTPKIRIDITAGGLFDAVARAIANRHNRIAPKAPIKIFEFHLGYEKGS